jgi:nitrogen fixation protein NifB
VKKTLFAGARVKNLSVAGIAGPGDALANPKQTFETLKLLREHASDLKLCVSTNGLRLAEFADDLIARGVDHITVTINAVDRHIGAKIYAWVYDTRSKRRLSGIDGAALLLERQLEGIEKAVKKGALIKANSVLIPNINDDHLVEVSATLKRLGVFTHNIMPLLSEPRFGTFYALNGVSGATSKEVQKAQRLCGINVKQMTHCHQCRADAIGLLGEDKSGEIAHEDYAQKTLGELKSEYENAARAERWEAIETFRRHLSKASDLRRSLSSNGKTVLIAVTSVSGETIDTHFGSCETFYLYEAGDLGSRLYSKRNVASYCSGEASCGSGPIDGIKQALKGVKLLLTAKIGECPQRELQSIGVRSAEEYADMNITEALVKAARNYFGKADMEAE